MKKFYLFIVIVVLLSGCVFKEVRNQSSPMSAVQDDNSKEAGKTVKINDREIKVEIADTPESQYKGLSFKENLCVDCGMLFKFSEKSEKTFVMRNMNFPLDIIFIDDEKIVKIEKNLKPEGENPKNFYNSSAPVDYVLEVNAGYVDSHNIKIGDKIIFSL